MARDTGIADKLRRAGLTVVEVAGWQTRGSDQFNPRGFVWHHTAGPRSGNAPSLAICIYGRAGLPGPLCNVFLARDGTVYVVAAGRANHAGTGGWAGLSGNSSVYGLEVENVGTGAEPWQPFLVDIAARIAAALCPDHERCCHHKEWTARKPDMHTVSGRDMRARVAQLHAGPTDVAVSQLSQEDDDMYIRDTSTGTIYALTAVHWTALSAEQWADRVKEGAGPKLQQLPPEMAFHFLKSRLPG